MKRVFPYVIFSALTLCQACSRDSTGEGKRTVDQFTKREMNAGKKSNKLIDEKSPYLLQHAFNPVEWYPWGQEAFDKAKREGKPIFLSIGYSTCHWCHVMAHESFENDSIAAILNKYFVSIKVDREERPDVDKVYMTALQGMGQNGGWPLSMFLTPERKPFYGGTYFPPQSRYGRAGFPDLLNRIHEVWEKEHSKVLESAEAITAFLREASAAHESEMVNVDILQRCFEQMESTYDSQFGGFGTAPKFPRPVVFNFLLRYFKNNNSFEGLEMTSHTLKEMAKGGMYDHIGGGFHRYSVDAEWRVPHFEKMLYDQAQLAISYLEAYQITHEPQYQEIAREVLYYVLRDMTSTEGGFFSAEDADSQRQDHPEENGEGAFYVWSKNELETILGPDRGAIFSHFYGVEENGNVLADPQHEFTGKNILFRAHPLDETAILFGKSEKETGEILESARRDIFAVRAHRPRPPLDDKILTSWNGLMIRAFARAATVLQDAKHLHAATQAADFITAHLYNAERSTLLRRYRGGAAGLDAHLDDYAFFVSGLLELYEASLDIKWLKQAVLLTGSQIDIFWDDKDGGFFDTAGNDSSILVRMKEQYDGAEPTGNSVSAMNLLRLSQITNNDSWRDKARQTIKTFGRILDRQPVAMPQMVAAFDLATQRARQVIISGARNSEQTQRLLREVYSRYHPNTLLLLDDNASHEWLASRLDFIDSLPGQGAAPTAYVCEDFVCRLPTSDPEMLARLLSEKQPG